MRSDVEKAYRVPFAHYQVLTALGRTDEARAALEQAHQLLTRLLDGLSPEQRATSAERVPEHRAVLAVWQAAQPRRATVRLARSGAPAGRPLRADERGEVTWTPAAAEDEAIGGKAARRRHRLLRLLREADLSGADLDDAYAVEADLSKANLRGASLRGANLSKANLEEADLSGCDLRGADLTTVRFYGVRYDKRTRWPAGFTPPF